MAKNNRTPDRIQAVWNILGGEDGVDRLLAGELKVVEVLTRQVPVWKTVKLGTCKTPNEYRKALKSAGRRIGELGDDILDRITCAKEEIDLDLVVLSGRDLGFKSGARYADICAKAQEFGLERCPAEAGPALRLQYGDQPRGEWLRIAMEAIAARNGVLLIFGVVQDVVASSLYGTYGHPDYLWSASDRFVFGRRK